MVQATPRSFRMFLSKRRLAGLLGLSAVVIVGLLGKMLLFSPLPRGAYPVLSTALWTSHSTYRSYPYQWLPNGDLVYLMRNVHGMPQVCYQKMDARGPIGPLRQGPELPTDSLFDNFYASPDEQWVACFQYISANNFKTLLISADGKSQQQSHTNFLAWLADSRGYLAEAFIHGIDTTVFHLDSTRTEIIPKVSPNSLPLPFTTLPAGPSFVMGSHFTGKDTGIGVPVESPQMTLRSFSVSNPAIPEQTWQVTVPKGMDFGSASVSPDNKSLLWSVGKLQSSPWGKWLGRLNPQWQAKPTAVMHYFLSDLHGNNMRPVCTNGAGGSLSLFPTWTPDSKHLSFIYKDQLYLVPID